MQFLAELLAWMIGSTLAEKFLSWVRAWMFWVLLVAVALVAYVTR